MKHNVKHFPSYEEAFLFLRIWLKDNIPKYFVKKSKSFDENDFKMRLRENKIFNLCVNTVNYIDKINLDEDIPLLHLELEALDQMQGYLHYDGDKNEFCFEKNIDPIYEEDISSLEKVFGLKLRKITVKNNKGITLLYINKERIEEHDPMVIALKTDIYRKFQILIHELAEIQGGFHAIKPAITIQNSN